MNAIFAAVIPVRNWLFSRKRQIPLACILFVSEVILCTFIILRVNYTEIDWVAYMQEVEYFLNGTLDYDQIQGQTGPCVYPAGFLYIYSLFYHLTSGGSQLKLAQFIFMILYLATLILVFNIYRLLEKIPPFVFIFMCIISYRIHSIYILRLFNDPLAVIAIYACLNALLYEHFSLGCILFSVGVSIKMNILLYLPGLLLVLLWHRGILETIGHLCEILIVQLVVGAPFLFHNPEAYLSRAFNFGRQFMYKWTVNWRLIPEHVFLDRRFHLILFCLHLLFLTLLLFKFIRVDNDISTYVSLFSFYADCYLLARMNPASVADIIYPMFVSNFVGVVFSRSLHYQFYVWYFHTLVYLFWSVDNISNPLRLLVIGLIEICWNTYPSTVFSSTLLHGCHGLLLGGLVFSTCGSALSESQENPVTDKSSTSKRNRTKPKQA
ncbi:alpha-1,3-mannosyltransferase [Paragonimus westermani]|uniref:dolichyl-P-Man:Man5GlcNAc2-PP-dolichol alpha-1,3-mannosyltransferase n=1 Tax=Paragonimus westermani TaxID=34504 RepID=A0A5J4NE18_9TREM|nr:alpha-1,3-mannosyltransferase [Paragonimus westermani]